MANIKLKSVPEQMAFYEKLHTMLVVDRMSYRKIADLIKETDNIELSYGTIKNYIDEYRRYSAIVNKELTDARRADAIAKLNKLQALYLDIASNETEKTGNRILALNGYGVTLVHERAIYGLDAPKEIKQEIDNTYNLVINSSKNTNSEIIDIIPKEIE